MKSVISTMVIALVCSAIAVAQSSYGSYGNAPSNSSQAQISNGPVAETVSDSSAFLGWSTKDSTSESTVKYGTTRDHLSQTAQSTDTPDGKNHHARLQGLSPETTYYFQVMENGSPVGGIGTFKTVATGEKPIQSKAVISQK